MITEARQARTFSIDIPPLNTTREVVVQEACSLDLIRLPRPGRSQPRPDPALRCSYHQNIGHITEECTKVKDLIEELIQSSALARFVQKGRQFREGPRDFGARGGRGGGRGRGRGRGRFGPEEEKSQTTGGEPWTLHHVEES